MDRPLLSGRAPRRGTKLVSVVFSGVIVASVLLLLNGPKNEQSLDGFGTVLMEKPQIEKLEAFKWKSGDVKDGLPVVDCSDTVSGDPRFWGPVGTKYTVWCPDHCAAFGNQEVYGTEIFMDDSVICKAAISRGKLGECNPGKVTFQIVEPIKNYPPGQNMPTSVGIPVFKESSSGAEGTASDNGKCAQVPINTFPWTWTEWEKANSATPKGVEVLNDLKTRPAFKCAASADPQKCAQQKAIEKYRWHCTDNKNDVWPSSEVAKISPLATDPKYAGECFGIRAFKIMDGGQKHQNLVVGPGPTDFAESPSCSLASAATAITVETWVLDKAPNNGGYVSSLAFGGPTADSGFSLGAIAGTWAWSLAGTTSLNSPVARVASVSAPSYVTDSLKGKWTHLAGTYDGKTMLLYINGKPIGCGSTQTGPLVFTPAMKLAIGALKDYGPAGKVDVANAQLSEIRIWSRALPESEFTAKHMGETIGDGKEGMPSDLIAYFRFDGQDVASKKGCAETGSKCELTIGGASKIDESTSPVTMVKETAVCDPTKK